MMCIKTTPISEENGAKNGTFRALFPWTAHSPVTNIRHANHSCTLYSVEQIEKNVDVKAHADGHKTLTWP